MLVLKEYQKAALATLETFLAQARLTGDIATAFANHRQEGLKERYQAHPGLEHIPHVCLRIPTGGGKTLLAAHAVKRAARSIMERDFPVVLWLVPTDAIKSQTVDALKQPRHPYRAALDDDFPEGGVRVFDITDFEQVLPADLTTRVCILVGTFAALRVDDEKKGLRRLYSHNEVFEPHFSRLMLKATGLDRIEGGPDHGKIKFSFANLLRLHRPLLIVDEAHNAVTENSRKTWERINPACIIEFTATPLKSNNTLISVPATVLKSEQMIKLPVILREHEHGWQEALEGTTQTIARLRELASQEPGYLRPIALIKAEDKGKEATVDAVRSYLVDALKIPSEWVAIATGAKRDLAGVNLFDPDCPIEFVITNEALKEGWDCSFAYVFCSVAAVRSAKDIEQFLGRVLRMPGATRKSIEELNRAYAHVVCPSFAQAAAELVERMAGTMGFDEQEALHAILPQQPALPDTEGLPLFQGYAKPLLLTLPQYPDLSHLDETETAAVKVAEQPNGYHAVTVIGKITEEFALKLVQAVPVPQRETAGKIIATHRHFQEQSASPAEQGKPLAVPRLCVWYQDGLELAEQELFEEVAGWDLAQAPAELTPEEFAIHETATTFEIDLHGNRITYSLAEDQWQLSLDLAPTVLDERSFARLLDPELRRTYVTQPKLLEFTRRALHHLMTTRKFTLAGLLRAKYQLIRALDMKIKAAYRATLAKGYQIALFAPTARAETTFEFSFRFPPTGYTPATLYNGAWRFKKHYYPTIGELSASGEEFDCAVALDSLPQVTYWLRNPARQQYASFWLPTSTDRFYPDFVALLNDGRILVVEYKGALLADGADSEEKRNIGELWEEKSGGKGLFIMVVKKDSQGRDMRNQLLAKLTTYDNKEK